MSHRRFFPGRSGRNRLRHTHLNGNRGFRNAFLMRLSPWETVPPPFHTDSRKCGGGRSICAAPCCASGLRPTCRPRLRPPAPLRRRRRCIAHEAPHRPCLSTRARRQESRHAACGLRPPEVSWPLLSLRGNWGGFAPANLLMPPRWRSPPLSWRGAWKEERKVCWPPIRRPCLAMTACAVVQTKRLDPVIRIQENRGRRSLGRQSDYRREPRIGSPCASIGAHRIQIRSG